MEKLLFTKRESYGSLGIAPRSLDYLVERGAITPVRIGRRVLFKKSDIQKIAQRGFHGKLSQKGK